MGYSPCIFMPPGKKKNKKCNSFKLITFDLGVLSFFKSDDVLENEYEIDCLGSYHPNNQFLVSASTTVF